MNYFRLVFAFLFFLPTADFGADKKKNLADETSQKISQLGMKTFAQPHLIKNGLDEKKSNAWWTDINTIFNGIHKNDIPDAITYFKLLNNVDIFIKNTVTKLTNTFGSLYTKKGDTFVPLFENSHITPLNVQELTDLNDQAKKLKKEPITPIIERMNYFAKEKSTSEQRAALFAYAITMESVLNQIIRETDVLLAEAKAKAGTYPKALSTITTPSTGTLLPPPPTTTGVLTTTELPNAPLPPSLETAGMLPPPPPPLPETQKPGTLLPPPPTTTGVLTTTELPNAPLPPSIAPKTTDRPASPLLSDIEQGAKLKHVESTPSNKKTSESALSVAIPIITPHKEKEESYSSDDEWADEEPLLSPKEQKELAEQRAKIQAAEEKQRALDKENADKLAAYKAKEASLTPEEKKARAELQAEVDKRAAEEKERTDKELTERLAKRRGSIGG